MEPTSRDAPGIYHLTTKRNDSLGARGRRLFFVSMLVVSVGIALAWATRGAWFVVPFAALEMLVLYAALRILERHAGDYESVSIDGDRLLIVRRERGRETRHEFNRLWARLIVTQPGNGDSCRLVVRSHGREVSVGELLTDEQRTEMAAELRKRLKNS